MESNQTAKLGGFHLNTKANKRLLVEKEKASEERQLHWKNVEDDNADLICRVQQAFQKNEQDIAALSESEAKRASRIMPPTKS